MSNRNNWLFTLDTSKIAHAVRKKIAYHQERFDYWNHEVDAINTKIKTEGIKITSYQNSAGERLEATIDSGLEDRLNEARSKRFNHESSLASYRAYYHGLQFAPPTLQLDADDIRWAGLVDDERSGE